jgi:sigma-B regulation protein RsbU (phosphoserine phosphatase)
LGLRARFIILVLAGGGLISAVMAWITFDDSRQALMESRQEQLFDLAQAQATKLSRGLIMVSQSAKTLANLLETYQPKNAAELEKLLRRQLDQAPGIFGMAAAYAPGAFVGGPRLPAPYLHRTRQGIKTTSLADGGYNFMRWDWYLIPTLLARPVWSEPYFDEGGGGTVMTTYSAPMVVKGKVKGVVTADVDLARLGQEVNRLAVGREGFAFLISRQGTFLPRPVPRT